MRKILSLVLVIVIVLTFSACSSGKGNNNTGDNSPNSAGNNSQEAIIEHTGKKINGEIIGASVFSEGLAFVCVNEDKEKTYCINKEGYIVFELDFSAANAMGRINSKFTNGLAKVGEGICDVKGNIIMPADVGATAFCDIALEGGYIIAEKVTSDFESSKKELGVMNTKFEWIINPNENLYNATGGISRIPNNTDCFYYNDYFYFEGAETYLNLKTGELTKQIDSFPSKQWRNNDKCFYDYDGNVMLNLESNATINMPVGSKFVNGKAPVRFINNETNKYYFTIINEKGEFLFEPIETIQFQNFIFDGKKVLLLDRATSPKTIVCYDVEGKMLGQIETESIAKNHVFTCYISDDIIFLIAGLNFRYTAYYYNYDFKKLF